MASRFIAGESVAGASALLLESRWKENIAFSVDLLGEACVSHAEAAGYRAQYLNLITTLPGLTASWPESRTLETDHLGKIPRVNVSIKISALDGHVSPIDAEGTIARLLENIGPLLAAAKEHDVFLNFDMEHHALKDLTIRLFKRCCERFDFSAGLALQAYLTSADADARDLVEWSRERRRVITIRLIKGAYWDYETLHAQLQNWPSPVWRHKSETDACFERITDYLLENMPRDAELAKRGGVKLAVGTHNVRSVAHALARVEQLGLPPDALEFQALRGMADDLKHTLADRHLRVREYQPVGDMIPGMAYLVRRLLENTSNESWLRAGQASGVSDEELLAAPEAIADFPLPIADLATVSVSPDGPLAIGNGQFFQNEPLRDFSDALARASFAAAVEKARVPVIDNDQTPEDALRAIEKAYVAFPAWRDVPVEKRAAIVEKAADQMHGNRDALSGLIVRK